MLLGAIADDMTGATDLASALLRARCRVVVALGVPGGVPPDVDAIIIATKSRMAPVDEAKAISAEAADFLQTAGADQLFYKYCSTFDSTEQGNIGPVTDLLLDRVGHDFTILCPSYPELKRTVYQGHMFVAGQLLSDSPMRNHPLTPMYDSNLVRFLGRQTPSQVGLIALEDVEAGPAALGDRFAQLRSAGVRMAVTDAIFGRHVEAIALACKGVPLVTGGAALGGALGRVRLGLGPSKRVAADRHQARRGPTALLSGSCSAMTLVQVANVIADVPSYLLDPLKLAADADALSAAANWALDQASRGDFLIYSSADAKTVQAAQTLLGRGDAASSLERAFGQIAQILACAGVRKFVVAGGETSGAVTSALNVRMLSFGDELAPGVPWTYTLDPDGFTLALKSGNFGGPDFFQRALAAA
jgi:uncharacterized protein YgbK (DUF1537 family)